MRLPTTITDIGLRKLESAAHLPSAIGNMLASASVGTSEDCGGWMQWGDRRNRKSVAEASPFTVG